MKITRPLPTKKTCVGQGKGVGREKSRRGVNQGPPTPPPPPLPPHELWRQRLALFVRLADLLRLVVENFLQARQQKVLAIALACRRITPVQKIRKKNS